MRQLKGVGDQDYRVALNPKTRIVFDDARHYLMTTQDKQKEESKKLRDSLDAIARGTAQLSDAGNPNARLVIEELKKRGVTVNPNPPATSGAALTPVPTVAAPGAAK